MNKVFIFVAMLVFGFSPKLANAQVDQKCIDKALGLLNPPGRKFFTEEQVVAVIKGEESHLVQPIQYEIEYRNYHFQMKVTEREWSHYLGDDYTWWSHMEPKYGTWKTNYQLIILVVSSLLLLIIYRARKKKKVKLDKSLKGQVDFKDFLKSSFVCILIICLSSIFVDKDSSFGLVVYFINLAISVLIYTNLIELLKNPKNSS